MNDDGIVGEDIGAGSGSIIGAGSEDIVGAGDG